MKMAFIMDPIESLNPAQDTTLVLMLEAQARRHGVFYVKPETLSARGSNPLCKAARAKISEPGKNAGNMNGLYNLGKFNTVPLTDMDVIWMRKDPPFNMDYIYLTHVLELAEKEGTAVINRPEAIRNSNEKLSALEFARFMPDTLVSKNAAEIKDFLSEKAKIVLKPLDGFGGEGIVMIEKGNENVREEIARATSGGEVFVMAQEFIPGVSRGDKRVIMLDGKPIGAVLRMPPEGKFICNFHSGGTPEKTALDKNDMRICSALGEVLREKGIYFAGIDIVDGMLTEINCTSPTCVREINRFNNTKLESEIMDFAETFAGEKPEKKR